MSQENVEIVRRFYEAGQRSIAAYWENRRSASAALRAGSLNPENEAVLAFLHPEVEYRPLAVAVEGGTVRGHFGWLKFWDDLMSAAEVYESTIDELTDLGGDEVLAEGKATFKWKGSGIKLSEPRFLLVTVRDGLTMQIYSYREREEALEPPGCRSRRGELRHTLLAAGQPHEQGRQRQVVESGERLVGVRRFSQGFDPLHRRLRDSIVALLVLGHQPPEFGRPVLSDKK